MLKTLKISAKTDKFALKILFMLKIIERGIIYFFTATKSYTLLKTARM
jgi:hypothetical protein